MIRTNFVYEIAKRLADVVFSLFVLLFASPFLLLTALWIKLDSRGPVFYMGTRNGRNGKPFRMYKFRSMVIDADKMGPSSTSDSDSRITKSGSFVRKAKLDEIPQFINVLFGHMSVIGPRPDVAKATDSYVGEQKLALQVRPGVVDYGTLWNRDEGEILLGSSDPDADYLQFILPTKMALSVEYVKTRSLWIDFRITVATFAAVFLKIEPKWCLPYGKVEIPEYTRDAIISRPAEEVLH